MNYEQKIITHYSPISARGGRKSRRKRSSTHIHKKSNTYSKNRRTRRRYR